MAYYNPTVWKSGGTRPPCPPPNSAHAPIYTVAFTAIHIIDLITTDTSTTDSTNRYLGYFGKGGNFVKQLVL